MSTASPPPRDDDRLLDAHAAAGYLNVSHRTLANLRLAGLASVKLGRLRRYRLADLREYVARHRQGGVS